MNQEAKVESSPTKKDTFHHKGDTALPQAVGTDPELAKSLIEAKVELNATDRGGRNALAYAALYGNTEIIAVLIEHKVEFKVEFNTTNFHYGKTALIDATEEGSTKCTTALIKAKAELNAANIYGKTALIYAAERGRIEIVAALIDAKADLNTTDEDGYTALVCAILDYPDIATALIDAKANLNTTDKDGYTALMHATIKRDRTPIATALIDAKAELNTISQYGETAFFFAVSCDRAALATALLDAKANPNAHATDLLTNEPLLWATKKGHTATVKALIEAKANPNAIDKSSFPYGPLGDREGDTPLIYAARHGHTEIAIALIAAKAELNTSNKYGKTALRLATKGGHTEIVSVLTKCRLIERNEKIRNHVNLGLSQSLTFFPSTVKGIVCEYAEEAEEIEKTKPGSKCVIS